MKNAFRLELSPGHRTIQPYAHFHFPQIAAFSTPIQDASVGI